MSALRSWLRTGRGAANAAAADQPVALGGIVLPRFLRRPARLLGAPVRRRFRSAALFRVDPDRRPARRHQPLRRLSRRPVPGRRPGRHVAARLRHRRGQGLRPPRDIGDRHPGAARPRRLDLDDRLRCRGRARTDRRAALGADGGGAQDLSGYARSPHRGAQAFRDLAARQRAFADRAVRQGDHRLHAVAARRCCRW